MVRIDGGIAPRQKENYKDTGVRSPTRTEPRQPRMDFLESYGREKTQEIRASPCLNFKVALRRSQNRWQVEIILPAATMMVTAGCKFSEGIYGAVYSSSPTMF